MKVLELFAGSRSIGKSAEKAGHQVFSVDWKNYENINLSIDIEEMNCAHIPFIPDYVHAYFDCTTYTIAAISTHRDGAEPKSEYAKKCDRVNQRVIHLIKQWLLINPNLKFSFENPRGMLRKMPFMQEFKRYTIWYCQYGDDRAKPTDIWTNLDWIPRPVCHNGNKNCHHQPAPRGSKTGTQGKANHYERSKIPEQLCDELIKSLTKNLLAYRQPSIKMETKDNSPAVSAEENKMKAMTQVLRLTFNDEQVGNYLRWIISSDMPRDHWAATLKDRDREIECLKQRIKMADSNADFWKRSYDKAVINGKYIEYQDALARNEKLAEAIKGAMAIKDLWLIYKDTCAPEHETEAIAIQSMHNAFVDALSAHEKEQEGKGE